MRDGANGRDFGNFLGLKAQFWMNLQSHYDLEIAKDAIAGKSFFFA